MKFSKNKTNILEKDLMLRKNFGVFTQSALFSIEAPRIPIHLFGQHAWCGPHAGVRH